jgi:hypothetical protein
MSFPTWADATFMRSLASAAKPFPNIFRNLPKHVPVRNVALGAALGAAFHMAPGLAIQNRVRTASGQSPKSTPPSTPPSTRSRNLHRPADADIVEPMTTLTVMNVAILAPMRTPTRLTLLQQRTAAEFGGFCHRLT